MSNPAAVPPTDPEEPSPEMKTPGGVSTARGWALHAPMLIGALLLAGWYRTTFEHWRLQWAMNDYYAHAPLIPVLVAVTLWLRRERLAHASVRMSLWGLPVILFGGLLKLGSTWISATGVDAFASVSFPIVLWGLILGCYGPAVARALAEPAAFLLFMCPLPGYAVAEISFPLQMLSTTVGATLATLAGVELYQQGSTIYLGGFSLFVDVACSGFKSVLSLLALSSFAAITSRLTASKKWMLVLSSIPIGLAGNAIRIGLITWAAEQWGRDAAVRVHDQSGLFMLGLACAGVLLLAKVLGWLDNTETW